MVEFSNVVTSVLELRNILGEPSDRVLRKEIAFLDGHCAAFIQKASFVLVASADRRGQMDVSPKGDPPGFVHILDNRTLAIPDRPGNRRIDTFRNVLKNPQVGLLFLVPGKQETLRVAGRASIVRDRALLEAMHVDGKVPALALVVHVEQVMFHCGKCVIRSGLWSTERWPDPSGLPTLAEAMVLQGGLEESVTEMQALIERDAVIRLY
jgi:PPOX class probable FMN-dependent enzyme